MDGLEAYVESHGLKGQVQFAKENIGFGVDSKSNLQAAERLLLDEKADVLIAFLDHPNVALLYSLAAHLNKPVIVVNHGAKYPLATKPPGCVIFHTLNEVWHSWHTGVDAAASPAPTGLCTSFYDGGYQIFHAASEALMIKGRQEPACSFVSRHNAQAAEYAPLVTFLNDRPDIRSLVSAFSGDQAHLFLSALGGLADPASLTVYGSPMLFDESLPELFGDLRVPFTLKGHTAWLPGLNNAENNMFVNAVRQRTGRRASHAGVLGWDTGLLLGDIASMGTAINGTDYVRSWSGKKLKGAKGTLFLDAETAYIVGDSYAVRADAGFNLTLDGPIEGGTRTWKEMLEHRPDNAATGWVNTYLCS